jgi:hypothetical protein
LISVTRLRTSNVITNERIDDTPAIILNMSILISFHSVLPNPKHIFFSFSTASQFYPQNPTNKTKTHNKNFSAFFLSPQRGITSLLPHRRFASIQTPARSASKTLHFTFCFLPFLFPLYPIRHHSQQQTCLNPIFPQLKSMPKKP